MAFTENFADFFNEDTPGYVLAEFDGNDVGVIFDNGYDQQFNTTGTNPFITAAEADFATAEQGDVIAINGTDYTIDNLRPDGTGIVQIDLLVTA